MPNPAQILEKELAASSDPLAHLMLAQLRYIDVLEDGIEADPEKLREAGDEYRRVLLDTAEILKPA